VYIFTNYICSRNTSNRKAVAEEATERGGVTYVRSRNANADCFEDSRATFAPLKTLIKQKHQSDEACYAVSANLIFPINYRNDIPHRKEIYCGRGLQIFFVCAQVYWSQ
jgi:hypothetical protein